jgi:hypothetical protein
MVVNEAIDSASTMGRCIMRCVVWATLFADAW